MRQFIKDPLGLGNDERLSKIEANGSKTIEIVTHNLQVEETRARKYALYTEHDDRPFEFEL